MEHVDKIQTEINQICKHTALTVTSIIYPELKTNTFIEQLFIKSFKDIMQEEKDLCATYLTTLSLYYIKKMIPDLYHGLIQNTKEL